MQDPRSPILAHALKLAPFDGWSDAMLRDAAARANVSATECERLFPKGAIDCLNYFIATSDEQLSAHFAQGELTSLKLPVRIRTILLARFHDWLPHREAVRRAIASRLLPWNVLEESKHLYRTVDLMWKLAGDHPTDFSFYTKRMTLAGVYISTLLLWLDDQSDGQTETKAFLDRRLQNIADFGRWKKEFLEKKKIVS